jgi:transcriptional regulator with XRE-family HTH domain
MSELKDRLKEALYIRGMTAAELARQSGLDKGSISNYLKGKFIPKQNAIASMARALGVSPAWLMGYDLTMDGDKVIELDLGKLTELNRAKVQAYYQALIDSQEKNKE